jgi:hypothetical protein
MEEPTPALLHCLLTDNSIKNIDLFKPLKVYCIYNVDKPVVAFWNKDSAVAELDEIHKHIKATSIPPSDILDWTMRYHIVEICMPALFFLMEDMINGKA